jgi:hypothetical protein
MINELENTKNDGLWAELQEQGMIFYRRTKHSWAGGIVDSSATTSSALRQVGR